MKTPAIAAFTLVAAAAISFAQDIAKPPSGAPERPAAAPKDSGTPDHPQKEYGAHGWTGGNRGSGSLTTGQSPGAEPAGQEPEMATGVDLSGPPKRFRPSETPE